VYPAGQLAPAVGTRTQTFVDEGVATQTWFAAQVPDDREAPQKFVVVPQLGVPAVGDPPAVQLGLEDAVM
jgi:hypothetical protein